MEKLSLTVFIHVTMEWMCVYIFMSYHPPKPKVQGTFEWGYNEILGLVPWNMNVIFPPSSTFEYLWQEGACQSLQLKSRTFFSSNQNIFQALLLLYLPYYCVQNSSSVCQQVVVLVNIHTYFTALQLGPEFEQESIISPFSELPLAVYSVGCGVGHRF